MTAVIPHPPRIPVVGDLVKLSASTFVQDHVKLAAKLGPIFERTIFGTKILFVSGADLVAELNDEQRFAKNVGKGLQVLRPLVGDGLVSAYNDEPNWAAAHEVLMPAFTQAAMRRYHPMMLDVAAELTESWDRAAGGTVDVASDMTKMTLETLGRAGFNYSFESFQRARPHPFVRAMWEALAYGQQVSARVPVIGDLLGKRADQANEDNIALMNAVVDSVIAARTDNSGDDLLGLMLDSGKLDLVNIRYQVITFLIAGHETTAGGLTFALHYLATNPDAAARVRAEVDEVWGDTETPTFEQVTKLRYTRRAFDEALRLWPSVPMYGREAREDTVIDDRYPVSAGQSIFILLPALHREKATWGPDADSYSPDRMLPQHMKARPAHAFKPFGTGPRSCIGRQFALHEAVLVLGTLLRRYDLHPDPAYRLTVKELLSMRPVGLLPRITRRAD